MIYFDFFPKTFFHRPVFTVLCCIYSRQKGLLFIHACAQGCEFRVKCHSWIHRRHKNKLFLVHVFICAHAHLFTFGSIRIGTMVLTPWRSVSRLTPAYRDLQENALIVSILFKRHWTKYQLFYVILFVGGGWGEYKHMNSICEQKKMLKQC